MVGGTGTQELVDSQTELVPFSSSQTSTELCGGGRGCREGPIPSHQEPGQTQRLGKQAG